MSLTDLADLADGRLDGVRRERLETLLARNELAAEDQRWLQRFLDTARSVPLAPRSPLVDQRLRQYFTRWAQAQAVLSAPSVRIRAELVFDSRQDRLVGVRGESDAVNLVYACSLGELVVDVLPARDRQVRLLGQVLLEEPTTSPVFEAAVVAGGVRRTAESDLYGRFRLDGLAAAPAELRVGNGEVEISASLELAAFADGEPGHDQPDTAEPTGHDDAET